jgi:NitT/TauT family transport system permease protein
MNWTIKAWQVAILVGLFLAWQALGRISPIIGDVVGSPVAVFWQIFDWLRTGEIFRHLGVTSLEATIGFLIGAVLGSLVAFLLAFIPPLARLIDPLIGIFSVVPRIVLAPIFMIWFGLGVSSKAALVATIIFFIVYFNVEAGLRSVPNVLLDKFRTIGSGKFGLLWELYIPACVIWVLSGLRISIGFAFLGAVVSEYLGASVGIGSLVATGQSLNDPNVVMAGLIVILIVVVPLDRVLSSIERNLAGRRG